jgi:hypothetical protein
MPFVKIPIRIRSAAARVSAGIFSTAAAVKQAFRAAIGAIVGGAKRVGQICDRFLVACSNVVKACSRRGIAMSISAENWVVRTAHLAAAHIHRCRFLILAGVLVAIVVGLSWLYWPPDVVHRLLPRNKPDTPNGDSYYLVNIIFVPLQTFLLLVGGLYAGRTLSQNHKFKQHDVEARCIADYLALEQRLADAGRDNAKIENAVRAYWVLMLYEYYWWRHDLLSRELFTNWCEFRVQRFCKNPEYRFTPPALRSTQTLPFTNYQDGYEYFKKQKVFPSPSKFDDLMQSLIDRAKDGTTTLRWPDIERYRCGKDF